MSEEEEFEEVNLFGEDNRPITIERKPDAVAADLEAEGDQDQDEANEFVVPDKFKDKSLEDVITSYTNLESQYGRTTNENGELRKLTDEILKQGMSEGNADDREVGFDDFVEDPEAAIEKALAKNPRLQAFEKRIADETQSQAHAAVVSAHSDADAVVASVDFQEWVMASASRQQRFANASNSYDAEAASDLITLYKSSALSANEAATTQRDAKAKAGLKAATTETGRVAAGESRKIYKRAELIKLKQYHPQKYTAMEPEIMLAYQEGRVK